MQSRLIALVLAASLATLLLTGLLSFAVARHLLVESGYQRLNTLRTARAEAIREHLEQLAEHVLTLGETRMTIDGIERFSRSFNALPDLNEAEKKELATYYSKSFTPKLAEKLGETAANTYLPSNPAERYLKYHYIVARSGENQAERSRLEDAGDGSDWSKLHSEYHQRFHRVAELFDYQDLMLVDIKTGNVVYSVAKEDDLGTNLLSGPYANTGAAKVFREIRKSRDPMFIGFSDFENYRPSFGKPTMFVGTTVFDGDDFVGALIFQLDNGRIDKLMTSNHRWREVGLGESGETYLLGQDSTFRSSPRPFIEDPGNHLALLRRSGLPEAVIQRIQKTGTPVLIQTVKTRGAQNALDGKSGQGTYKDYRGVPIVGSYQPISFGPFTWGLLAEIDASELFSGIRRLTRNLLLLAAVLVPALTLLSLWMARAFIRPIRNLLTATEKISAGNYAVHIADSADDEFGDLASAFNAMSDRISEREASLSQQIEEHNRLLLSIVPGSTASRLKQDIDTMGEVHPGVCVLFAAIEGWNELSQALPADQAVALRNQLTEALNRCSAADGLERLQNQGDFYVAISGLSPSDSQHEKRTVHCALAMLQEIRRFNQGHNVNLALDIGIHAGTLTTGVMRGERLSFDIWGPTVSIARMIHASTTHNVIRVTAPIVAALEQHYSFRSLPAIRRKGQGEVAIWEVEAPLGIEQNHQELSRT